MGFEKIGRRDYFRSSLPVGSLICELALRVGAKEVRINTGIEVYDPWIAKKPYYTTHLSGDVSREGIYVCYDETPHWVHPNESDFVFEVIKKCFPSWISYWQDPNHLIGYFNNPLDVILTRYSETASSGEFVFGCPVAKKRVAPDDDYVLSLLHYHVGNFKHSLDAAVRYNQFVSRTMAYEGEPDRTQRQIRELLLKANLSNT